MLSIPWATIVAFTGLALVPAFALPSPVISRANLAGNTILPAFSGACKRTVGWKPSTVSITLVGVMTAGGSYAR